MARAVAIDGLRDLERAFSLADRHVRQDLRDALQEAVSPVRADAKQLALRRIRNVRETRPGRSAWSDFRIGGSASLVYVAPVERGVKVRDSRRKRGEQFGSLLMDRAMEPALEKNIPKVEQRIERLLDEVVDVWERA